MSETKKTTVAPKAPVAAADSEKEALENMRGSKSFTPDPSREDKAVFDKIKDIF